MQNFEPIIIPIQTVTPVWTGNADGKTTDINATSILGGLRFWAEALVRSFGERVCDITGDSKDIYDKSNGDNQICRVCETFGCTGKGRSFALSVVVKQNLENDYIPNVTLSGEYEYLKKEINKKTKQQEIKKKQPKWYLGDDDDKVGKIGKVGKKGKFDFKITPLKPDGITPDMALALCLMLKRGTTIGALDQYGYGIVKSQIPESLIQLALKAIPDKEPKNKPNNSGVSLQDFFFFQIEGNENGNQLPFKIRCDVRNSIRQHDDKNLRHYFCGAIGNNNSAEATKFNLGLKPDKIITGWGYFPSDGSFGSSRERCLNILKDKLSEKGEKNTLKWIEFNSNRDTEKNITSWSEFLKKLLQGGL